MICLFSYCKWSYKKYLLQKFEETEKIRTPEIPSTCEADWKYNRFPNIASFPITSQSNLTLPAHPRSNSSMQEWVQPRTAAANPSPSFNECSRLLLKFSNTSDRRFPIIAVYVGYTNWKVHNRSIVSETKDMQNQNKYLFFSVSLCMDTNYT